VKPQHLGEKWRYLPLTKDRTPLKGYTKTSHPEYWEGMTGTWDDLEGWVAGGKAAMGLLAYESGLVILDCDDKAVFETTGNTAKMVHYHGINDLKRVCAELGREVPPTYTVETKSGGYHLYYRQHPDWLLRSNGHREDWRVDVKASPRVFAVAPPSVGYRVVRDIPVARMPEWLARWLLRLRTNTNPVGGEGVRHLMNELRDMRDTGVDISVGGSYHAALIDNILGIVRGSQQQWNNRIYLAARQLFDVGYTAEEAEEMLMEPAAPWNERETYNLRRTVGSAWTGHLNKEYGDAHWTYRNEL